MQHKVKYEVISRTVETHGGGQELHSVKLLYRGDGTPWHQTVAGLTLGIPPDMALNHGDHVFVTLEKA